MKRAVISSAVVVLTGIALWAVNVPPATAPGGVQACTLEAKLCPDGSSVGRTGPNCEFAQCPVQSGPLSLEARIGQEVSGLDVQVTPLAVLEDSRCPIDVQCIQAGTVRLSARLVSGLGTATPTFKLGETVTTEVEAITLVNVLPQKRAGIAIPNSEYVFQFEVVKRTTSMGGGILPYNSGVR